MERYATDLTLSFGLIISLCGYFSIFLSPACTTGPACQPEDIGRGMAIRVGSARREIRKLKYNPDGK